MTINFSWEYLCEAYKAGTITDEEIGVMVDMMDEDPSKRKEFDEVSNFKDKNGYSYEEYDNYLKQRFDKDDFE